MPDWTTVNVTQLADRATRLSALKTALGPNAQLVEVCELGGSSGASAFSQNRVGFFGADAVNVPTPLPRPFQAVPRMTAPAGKSLAAACTFCQAATGGQLGVVRFEPNGTVWLPTASAGFRQVGGSVALYTSGQNEAPQPKLIAIAAPAGIVKTYAP